MENLAFPGVDTTVLNFMAEQRASSRWRSNGMQWFSSLPWSSRFPVWAPGWMHQSSLMVCKPAFPKHHGTGEVVKGGRHFCRGEWKHGPELGSRKVRHDLPSPRKHSELKGKIAPPFWQRMFLNFLVCVFFSFTFPYAIKSAKTGNKKCNKGKEFCSLQQELPDL